MVDQDHKGGTSLVPLHLADRLRGELARKRMTQRELAQRASIPQPTIATYLAGRVNMPVSALVSIANAIGTDPGWLLLGEHYRLDHGALAYACMKALLSTNPVTWRDGAEGQAIQHLILAMASGYGRACNMVRFGHEEHDHDLVTIVSDFPSGASKSEA